jgi:hypothetical protein
MLYLMKGGPKKWYEDIIIKDHANSSDTEGKPQTDVPQHAADQAANLKPEPESESESESEIEDILTSTLHPSITGHSSNIGPYCYHSFVTLQSHHLLSITSSVIKFLASYIHV